MQILCLVVKPNCAILQFLARDVIYTSVSVCLSVCLSVTKVHWRIIVNLGFKLRSQFTAVHAGASTELFIVQGIIAGKSGGIISRYASHC